MDNKTVWQTAKNQLALDLGCDVSLLDDGANHVVLWRDDPGRRRYSADTPMLEVAVWNGKLVAACGEALLPWAQTYFPTRKAEWLFMPRFIREIEGALAPLGYELGNASHFYLPALPWPEAKPLSPVRWYEAAELPQFQNDPRWTDALAFGEFSPDVLAVAAVDDSGRPIAMAACSQDGEKLWQIGINVQPEHRGKGLAANLTALLKDEILRRGAVPFYGTAESHIVSQNVARSAGFRPAFAYLFARPQRKKET